MTSVEQGSSRSPGRYRLDELGWLQFERLAALALEAEAGLRDLDWQDRAYEGRTAWVDEPVVLDGAGVHFLGPVVVAVVWVRPSAHVSGLSEFGTRLFDLAGDVNDMVLITNLDDEVVRTALRDEGLAAPERVMVLGASALSQCLDRHSALRSAMPSVLGLCDLMPLISRDVRARSSFDIERARGLARVFVPTRAYERAREVLARHRFVVLTGPPEMGKTAIAHMVALAQLTAGWQAHDCTTPEQVWRAFDPQQPQVFVADDAFGSTEYRPDAAEHWARELARMLQALNERHWLIWTSRPAPLRSGLRRVQRERGSERFPAPGEVLVDASDLDLGEKTLILFRHVKDHEPSGFVRELVRSSGIAIVEHSHFTPERIRRFVSHRLDALSRDVQPQPRPAGLSNDVHAAVERELATPTEQMAASFRALEDEHRSVLIAMLDTPAGLTDERELAATVRRHHPGGFSRPPHELIDRLTDHFLRISSLGIDWVHPSWRDLVIDELRANLNARREFLRACGPYGALLALSQAGGATGERALPLMNDDGDWDTFTDRIAELLRELEDRDLARLLHACGAALGAHDRYQRAEAQSLAEYVLATTRRSWDKERRPLPVLLLEAWYEINSSLNEPLDPPQVATSYAELHPAALSPGGDDPDPRLATEWLALAQTLAKYDPQALEALGFPERERATLSRLVERTSVLLRSSDRDLRSLAEHVRAQLRDVAPAYAQRLQSAGALPAPALDDPWWVPEDIPAPPTTERARPASLFTREDVELVLDDL